MRVIPKLTKEIEGVAGVERQASCPCLALVRR
jgi:hypothetical protein